MLITSLWWGFFAAADESTNLKKDNLNINYIGSLLDSDRTVTGSIKEKRKKEVYYVD